MRVRLRLVLAAGVACAAAACIAAQAAPAGAQSSDPAATPSNWSSSPPGGKSISSLVTDGGIALPAPWLNTATNVFRDTEVIPGYRFIPYLRSFALTTAAFELGLKIGSTINAKWLHLEGVGLGNTQSVPAAMTTVRMAWSPTGFTCYVNADGTCGAPLPSGWYETGVDASCYVTSPVRLDVAYNVPAGYRPTCWSQASQAAIDALIASGAQVVRVDVGYINSACCGIRWPSYEWYIPTDSMTAALPVDQFQPYTNQPYGTSVGWPNPANGHGVTSDADPFGGGPTNPTPCYLSNGATTCSGTPDPSIPFGIPGLSADPIYSDAEANEMRCQIDPHNWGCPAVDSGTDWADTGGPKITMPDCYSMTVEACASTIDAALEDAGSGTTAAYSVAVAPTYDPRLANGLVVATLAAAGAWAAASSVTIEVNESQSGQWCQAQIDNYHLSKTSGYATPISYVRLSYCNFTSPPQVFLSAAAWACTSEPTRDAALLDTHAYGCYRVAEMNQLPFDVIGGVAPASGNQYLVGNVPYDGSKWHIASVWSTTTTPMVIRGWSQTEPNSGS
jgi:hypothetical protein